MATDIVERLRARLQQEAVGCDNPPVIDWSAPDGDGPWVQDVVCGEAAEEIERLRTALQALHDWYVEYARINNLFNPDGSPATFHELLEARAALRKP
jgi:hypothetical protein